MSIEHRPISPLRQRMIEDMRLRKLAEKTQSGYLRWVRDFTRFLGRAPDTATAEDLRRYQLHLSEQGTSRISLNAAVTALRFFFEITLGRGELMAAMSHVRVARTLPVVLSPEEITRLSVTHGAAAPDLAPTNWYSAEQRRPVAAPPGRRLRLAAQWPRLSTRSIFNGWRPSLRADATG